MSFFICILMYYNPEFRKVQLLEKLGLTRLQPGQQHAEQRIEARSGLKFRAVQKGAAARETGADPPSARSTACRAADRGQVRIFA
jgi:hypothetical protein